MLIVSKPVQISDLNVYRGFLGPLAGCNYEVPMHFPELLPYQATGQKEIGCWMKCVAPNAGISDVKNHWMEKIF